MTVKTDNFKYSRNVGNVGTRIKQNQKGQKPITLISKAIDINQKESMHYNT